MNYVFEIVDKTGRRIHLTKERWRHITSPESPHTYMANYLEETKQTLINPDTILLDIDDESKAKYYKYYKERKQFLRVIAKYLNGGGFVISAYFVKNIVK